MKGVCTMNYYIGLDIGGTHIKSGVITEAGTLLEDAIHMVDSHAKASKDFIIHHLYTIILNEAKRLPEGSQLLGVGLAFPGPFDYEKGISKIKGINKYESLYDLCIKDALLTPILSCSILSPMLTKDFSMRFANDATLYALGELTQKHIPNQGKCLCVCIGTGLGSTFLEDGKPITSREDVPPNGWVYDTPFKTSIIDDHLSARGILKLYKHYSQLDAPHVKAIAEAYASGDPSAHQTFHTFGEQLGEGLNLFLHNFPAKHLVIGGQIAKSYPYFEKSFTDTLCMPLEVVISPDTSKSTLLGVLQLFTSLV